MQKTLPKGHLSCLSNAFRYTPAIRTNVADTFARINWELKERETNSPASREPFEPVVVRRGRPFPFATIESAWRLLRAGGLRRAPRLVHSSDL